MANITKTGTGGAVRIAVGGTTDFETVANLRSWSVDESVDTVEDTSMSSNGIRSYKTTHKTWSASADVYLTFDNATATAEVENFGETAVAASDGSDAITIGTSYEWEFYADDGDTFGHESYKGTGIVTGVSRSLSHDGMAEMSVTIQGNSALT
jgi:predicted secreted protein